MFVYQEVGQKARAAATSQRRRDGISPPEQAVFGVALNSRHTGRAVGGCRRSAARLLFERPPNRRASAEGIFFIEFDWDVGPL